MNSDLGAVQGTKFKVDGGVQKGGLRFVVRVLVTLGWVSRHSISTLELNDIKIYILMH